MFHLTFHTFSFQVHKIESIFEKPMIKMNDLMNKNFIDLSLKSGVFINYILLIPFLTINFEQI